MLLLCRGGRRRLHLLQLQRQHRRRPHQPRRPRPNGYCDCNSNTDSRGYAYIYSYSQSNTETTSDPTSPRFATLVPHQYDPDVYPQGNSQASPDAPTASDSTASAAGYQVVDQNTGALRCHRRTGLSMLQWGRASRLCRMINIHVGDTVPWTWASSGHSVSSGIPCTINGQFCSPDNTNCPANEHFPTQVRSMSTPFPQSGTYSYFCAAHCSIGMTGVINVAP